MNVRFISTIYCPGEKERTRLDELQRQLGLWKAELSYSLREVQGYEKWIRIEIYHRKFRERAIKLAPINKSSDTI